MTCWIKCLGANAVGFFIGAVIAFILIFAGKPLFSDFLTKIVGGQVKLLPSTYQMWGELPGDSDTQIQRNVTVFNWANPLESFFDGAVPQVWISKNYEYNEFLNMTNTAWSNNSQQVSFFYWDYVKNVTDDSDLATVVNVGPITFWRNGTLSNQTQLGVAALGSLALSLYNETYFDVIGMTVVSAFCTSYATFKKGVLDQSGIDDAHGQMMWNDPVYGFGNNYTNPIWMKAAVEGNDCMWAIYVRDYFRLSYQQTQLMFSSSDFALKWIPGSLNIANNHWQCPTGCNQNSLMWMQWSNQTITNDPPQGFPPMISVTTLNQTTLGFPEISYFLHGFWLPQLDLEEEEEYMNVQFTNEQAAYLLNFSLDATTPVTNEDTLIHIGNQVFTWTIGLEFDASNSSDLSILQPIMDRYNLDSLEQTRVLWEYDKYIINNFAELVPDGGNTQSLIMGFYGATGIYYAWADAMDYLLLNLTSYSMSSYIQNNSITCNEFIAASFEQYNESQVTSVCSNPQMTNISNVDLLSLMIRSCWAPHLGEWQELNILFGYPSNSTQLLFCTDNSINNSYAYIYDYVQNMLNGWYGCINVGDVCSKYELAVIQWTSSNITLNPPYFLRNVFPPSITSYTWAPDYFANPWEYNYFINTYEYLFAGQTVDTFNFTEAQLLLTFERLFNSMRLSRALVGYMTNNVSAITDNVFWTNPDVFIQYIRYSMVEVAFGGLTTTRTIRELMFGYEDEFLKSVAEMNPILGGDPSIPYIVFLMDINETLSEAEANEEGEMDTGVDDLDDLRYFTQWRNITYSSIPDALFNGNITIHYNRNPWREFVPINGGDGIFFAPNVDDKKEIPIYIPMLARNGALQYQNKTEEVFGFETLKYSFAEWMFLNYTNYEENYIYCNDKWNGVFNITSVMKAPIFISNTYCYGCDEELLDAIEVYEDEDLEIRQYPNGKYNTTMYLEPHSGIMMAGLTNTQANIEILPDLLFGNAIYSLIPLYNLQRGGNVSEEMLHTTLKPLKFFIPVIDNMVWESIVGFFVSLIVGGISIYLCMMLKKKEKSKVEAKKENFISTAGQENLENFRISSNTEPLVDDKNKTDEKNL